MAKEDSWFWCREDTYSKVDAKRGTQKLSISHKHININLNNFLSNIFIIMVSTGFDKIPNFPCYLINFIIFPCSPFYFLQPFCYLTNAVAAKIYHTTCLYWIPSGTKSGILWHWHLSSNQHSRISCRMNNKTPPLSSSR